MYIIVWEYRVDAVKQSEFEKFYASNGAWAELFKKSAGYLGTELLHSEQTPGRYLTIDRWESAESYETFLVTRHVEYTELDKVCEGLTIWEKRIDSFGQVTD